MKRIVFLLFAGLFLSATCGFSDPAAPKDDDKDGTIAGIAIKRTGEGWLGVEVKDGTFHLTFYSDRKKPVPADKTTAVFRWPVHYQPNDERTELTATDDPSVLASSYTVRPPLSFKLHISLLSDSTKDPEGYVIDFSG